LLPPASWKRGGGGGGEEEVPKKGGGKGVDVNVFTPSAFYYFFSRRCRAENIQGKEGRKKKIGEGRGCGSRLLEPIFLFERPGRALRREKGEKGRNLRKGKKGGCEGSDRVLCGRLTLTFLAPSIQFLRLFLGSVGRRKEREKKRRDPQKKEEKKGGERRQAPDH